MQTLQIIPEDKKLHDNRVNTTLPTTIGQGGVAMMRFNTGISLHLSNYRLHSSTAFEYLSSSRVYGFGFCLSGDISSHPAGFKYAEDVRAGQNALFHFEGGKMKETVSTKQVIRLNIMMTPERFERIIESDTGQLAKKLQPFTKQPQRIFGTLTPAMHNSIRQILECPFQGPARELFMESKALELIACKFHQLSGGTREQCPKRQGIKGEDLDRVRYAGQLLVKNLETPPCLAELARQAGMCQSRFYQCFRDIYGIPPFDYLRRKRLDAAEQLLRQGELTVTQIALSVGYLSLSHFAKAFKQHIGLLPSQYQRNNGITPIPAQEYYQNGEVFGDTGLHAAH